MAYLCINTHTLIPSLSFTISYSILYFYFTTSYYTCGIGHSVPKIPYSQSYRNVMLKNTGKKSHFLFYFCWSFFLVTDSPISIFPNCFILCVAPITATGFPSSVLHLTSSSFSSRFSDFPFPHAKQVASSPLTCKHKRHLSWCWTGPIICFCRYIICHLK